MSSRARRRSEESPIDEAAVRRIMKKVPHNFEQILASGGERYINSLTQLKDIRDEENVKNIGKK